MNLKIYDDSKNYTAQVIKLPKKEVVPGADNIVKVTIFGNDCLIGKDSLEDILYLFFPSGTQLSKAFLESNNLYRESQINSDTSKKGFFEVNGRVKSIKLRGVLSTGFIIPVFSLENLPEPKWEHLKEGDSFNEIDGVEICRKYKIPTQSQPGVKGDRIAKVNNKLADLLIPSQFRFHSDTAHFANNLHAFSFDDLIVITDKWHGSSCILSKVYVAKKLSYWQKFINWLGGNIEDRQLAYIYSSGKPKSNLPKGIEGVWKNDGPDYYTSDIWKTAMNDYKNALEDGISIYGELVGFTSGGSAIQNGYDYGCSPTGQVTKIMASAQHPYSYTEKTQIYKFIVYRITYTKPDGNVIEFSWKQIKEYCKKYNLDHAKEFFYGSFRELFIEHVPISSPHASEKECVEELFQSLQTAYNLEKICKHCTTNVPAEGVVIRRDGLTSFSAYKLKSKLFLKKESDDLDKGETNIEDNEQL